MVPKDAGLFSLAAGPGAPGTQVNTHMDRNQPALSELCLGKLCRPGNEEE